MQNPKPESQEHMDNIMAKLKLEDENYELNLINDIFGCDFNKPLSLSRYYAYQLPKFLSFALANKNLFRFCMKSGLGMQTCVRPKIFGEVCEMFPKRLVFDHDFDFGNVEKLLEKNDIISDGPTLKVILLVRDPRAVANSREFLGLCDAKHNKACIDQGQDSGIPEDCPCIDIPKLCNKLDMEVNTGTLKFMIIDSEGQVFLSIMHS